MWKKQVIIQDRIVFLLSLRLSNRESYFTEPGSVFLLMFGKCSVSKTFLCVLVEFLNLQFVFALFDTNMSLVTLWNNWTDDRNLFVFLNQVVDRHFKLPHVSSKPPRISGSLVDTSYKTLRFALRASLKTALYRITTVFGEHLK